MKIPIIRWLLLSCLIGFFSCNVFGMQRMGQPIDWWQGENVRFKYTKDIAAEDKQKFETSVRHAVEQIRTNGVGRTLLEKITEKYILVEDKCAGIIFTPGPVTAFCIKKVEDKIELKIEIANFSDSKYPALHKTERDDVIAISAVETPFWITLAHELIHLKHRLEEIQMCPEGGLNIAGRLIKDIPYSNAKEIGIREVLLINDYLFLYKQLPELSDLRIKITELWTDLEERRTVIGPDNDNISEASIRKEAEIPTRYIYQSKDIESLEKKETVLQSLYPTDAIYKADSAAGVDNLMKYITQDGSEVSCLTPICVIIEYMAGTDKDEHAIVTEKIADVTRKIAENIKGGGATRLLIKQIVADSNRGVAAARDLVTKKYIGALLGELDKC